ncbi:MAG TPA: MtrB/PioB family decaheme-associated outer membrane protein, partial [Gammaproteobacteria bacterium]|nr:MtrB/PioB family decaheme-associated outer membrane protein [Gammaproteobacteria bacterium]
GMLFSALEFVSPVDYSTDDVEVMLDYYGSNWQLGISYFNSMFRNSNDDVRWDNPYNVVPGASYGQQAQPPDNDAQRVTIAGYVSLPARTSIAGSLSTGRLRQNADLLPFTTNTGLPVAALPNMRANARADTTNFDLRVTSSPWSRLTLSGNLELRDFDNETPIATYAYIVTDALAAANPATSSAYDFDKRELKLRAQYRQSSGTKLEVGAKLERFARSRQARRQTDTERFWVSARTRAGNMNDLSVEIFDEHRDGSSFEPILDATTPENPLMRKYHLADRDRRGATFRSAFIGGDRSDFGFEIELSNDRYDESMLGITDTDYSRVGADYSVLYSERTTLYVNAYKERFESSQSNSQSFGAADWTSTIDDEFDTVTVGGNIAELFGTVELDLEAGWSRSVGQISNDTSAVVSALPDVRSRRRYARIGVSYPYSERLDLHFDYYYESLDTSDWALDGVDPATAPALLSLGTAAWRYRVNVLYFSVAMSLAPWRHSRPR